MVIIRLSCEKAAFISHEKKTKRENKGFSPNLTSVNEKIQLCPLERCLSVHLITVRSVQTDYIKKHTNGESSLSTRKFHIGVLQVR